MNKKNVTQNAKYGLVEISDYLDQIMDEIKKTINNTTFDLKKATSPTLFHANYAGVLKDSNEEFINDVFNFNRNLKNINKSNPRVDNSLTLPSLATVATFEKVCNNTEIIQQVAVSGMKKINKSNVNTSESNTNDTSTKNNTKNRKTTYVQNHKINNNDLISNNKNLGNINIKLNNLPSNGSENVFFKKLNNLNVQCETKKNITAINTLTSNDRKHYNTKSNAWSPNNSANVSNKKSSHSIKTNRQNENFNQNHKIVNKTKLISNINTKKDLISTQLIDNERNITLNTNNTKDISSKTIGELTSKANNIKNQYYVKTDQPIYTKQNEIMPVIPSSSKPVNVQKSNFLNKIQNKNANKIQSKSLSKTTSQKEINLIPNSSKSSITSQDISKLNTRAQPMKSLIQNPIVVKPILTSPILTNAKPSTPMPKRHSSPLQDFQNFIEKAKADNKVFTICGNFYSIRRSLLQRGWIEKINALAPNVKEALKPLECLSIDELFEGTKDKENGEKYRNVLIHKLLTGYQADFYWAYGNQPFTINFDKIKYTIINQYPPGSNYVYGSKAGLCNTLSESHWFSIEGISSINYPRTYNLTLEYDVNAFIDDFRLTACVSLLKWIVEKNKAKDANSPIVSIAGKIPIAVFTFAAIQCHNYLKTKQHKDIDKVPPVPRDNDWQVFLDKYYKIIHDLNHFKLGTKMTKEQMVDQATLLMEKIEKYWPNFGIDGYMNLWLLKPSHGSQGSGILVCRTLKYMLDTITNVKQIKYVVQKYIERPLLVHNTKFDIRQYFLLTHRPTLQLWMYKDSYLKFSSQAFQLDKLHASIHLTNNCVQRQYKLNTGNNCLPTFKMWHSDTFKEFLDDLGYPSAWDNMIYKGMKEAILAVIMCCQDRIIPRMNSFEVWGVDFMVSADFKPYLIEINTRPDMSNTTPITGQLCPVVLEDVVKVIVDIPKNPKASTGKFELIYNDCKPLTIPRDKACDLLVVNGINYFTKYKCRSKIHELPKNKEEIGLLKNILNINSEQVQNNVKCTLEKILSIGQAEKEGKFLEDEKKENQTGTFKNMLSEFVTIISSKNENEKNNM